MRLEIDATCGRARTGRLILARGSVLVPAFMPVGTAASLKLMQPEDVAASGAEIILGNVYHLMLRPGAERIARRWGGMARFMNWKGPILTDSGGFQVMSLSRLRRISEEGVVFRAHTDGRRHFLTPESSMRIQRLLDSDIQMVLDVCPRFDDPPAHVKEAASVSMRWARRCKNSFRGMCSDRHALFGIVQGGMDAQLRGWCIKELLSIGFDGYALGGLAVGEGHARMLDMVKACTPLLPAAKPRYLMGVGKPHDVLGAVAQGIDMFDCVLPTRNGRHGLAYTRTGCIDVLHRRYANSFRPLDDTSCCPASRDYSLGYLHHLFRAKEGLGQMLLSWHNLHFYQQLMCEAREAIRAGTIEALYGHYSRFYA